MHDADPLDSSLITGTSSIMAVEAVGLAFGFDFLGFDFDFDRVSQSGNCFLCTRQKLSRPTNGFCYSAPFRKARN